MASSTTDPLQEQEQHQETQRDSSTLSSPTDANAAIQDQKRKRVRTGCITCRVRRVKCDEARPHCKKCTSTGRKCDGYDAPSVSRNELARAIRRGEPLTSLQYGANTFTSPDERQAFEFFRRNTAVAGEANILDWGFWDQIVLQFVHTDGPIKHGVLALSSLHRNFVRGHEDYSPSEPEYFKDPKTIRWYSQALAEMQSLFESIDTDPAAVQKVIAASIIFMCIENLLADPKAARMHLENALRIEKEDQAKRSRKGKLHSRESVVTQALSRLDFGAMTLSSAEAPYPWKNDGSHASYAVRVPTTFTSLHQGEMWLFALLRDMFSFGQSLLAVQSAFEMLGKITRAATWYVQQLTNWKLAFEPLAAHLERLDETTRNRCLLLRVYHRLGFMLGSAGFMPTEMGWDACDDQFNEMLDWIEGLPTLSLEKTVFSLEPGVLVPLFMAATRCRHPVIRQRALALMRKQRRKEMVWESHGAAVVAQWLIEIEENGKRPKTEDGRPHEQDRFRVIDVDIDVMNSRVHIKVFLASETSPSRLRTVKETLDICMGTGSRDDCICGRHGTGGSNFTSSTRNEWEFERKWFDNERMGNARGWVPLGRINITSAESPENYELMGGLIGAGLFEVSEPTGMNGRSNRVEDWNPPRDEITTHLQNLTTAQEVIGERHISMMQWSAQKYFYEKVKVGAQDYGAVGVSSQASDDSNYSVMISK